MDEIWKDCKGYEGFYEVSNLGRIRSLERIRENWTNGIWVQPEKILKQGLSTDGYPTVHLTQPKGKSRVERVHRLVALAFIDNPDKLPEVNHINGIRNDNRAENLEWVSHEQNTHKRNTATKNNILCLDTGVIFKNSTEAAECNGGASGNIRKSARANTIDCIKRTVYGHSYIYIPNPDYYENLRRVRNNGN